TRSPISRSWKTAPANAQRYGRRRWSTFATRRSVLPTRRPSGRLGRRGGHAAVHRAEPEPRGHDVVGVVQDPGEADVLREDHTQVDEAERGADTDHLRDLEDEAERDENREEAEAQLCHAGQPDLGADVQQALRPAVVLGGDGHARLRPDAAEDLDVPLVPAWIDGDQVLARDEELHHA